MEKDEATSAPFSMGVDMMNVVEDDGCEEYSRTMDATTATKEEMCREMACVPLCNWTRLCCTPTRNYLASLLQTRMPLSLRRLSRRLFDSLCRPARSLSLRRTSRPLANLAAATSPPHSFAQLPGLEMQKSFGNFDLIRRDVLDFSDITVSRWMSRVTGLTVIHLDYEGTFAPLQKVLLTGFSFRTCSTHRQGLFHRSHRE